jgi:pimeloyl-ACP methyl ester carboxylesterase
LPTIDHEGRRISYELAGPDEAAGPGPRVLLLPPGASPATAWRPVMAQLIERFGAAGVTMAAVNFAGYGETERLGDDGPRTLEAEADAAAAVAGALGGPFHLVGHSYGGAIALRLAVSGARPLASLTLIEPAAYHLLRGAGEPALADEVEAVNFGFVATVAAGEPEAAFRAYIDYYTTGAGAWDALPETARARFLGIADVVAKALASAHGETTSLDDFRALAIPCAIVYGAETTRVHARVSELLAAVIPGARLQVVPEAGHMLTLTHPEAVAAMIAEVVAR